MELIIFQLVLYVNFYLLCVSRRAEGQVGFDSGKENKVFGLLGYWDAFVSFLAVEVDRIAGIQAVQRVVYPNAEGSFKNENELLALVGILVGADLALRRMVEERVNFVFLKFCSVRKYMESFFGLNQFAFGFVLQGDDDTRRSVFLQNALNVRIQRFGNFYQGAGGRKDFIVLDLGKKADGEIAELGHVVQRVIELLPQGFDFLANFQVCFFHDYEE